jgi:WD40 repeat protein
MESFPHPVVKMGLDTDWPAGVTIQTYEVMVVCLSPSEDILGTGGHREGMAVYSVWDVRTAGGETFAHPCRTHDCSVRHVSFDQKGEDIALRTGCICGKLCSWNISSGSPSLMEEIRLASIGTFWWWAEDGSKALSMIKSEDSMLTVEDQDGPDHFYHISIVSNPPIYRDLGMGKFTQYLFEWKFSPGHGDKLLRICVEMLTVWESSSGHQIFQILHKGVFCAQFSLDSAFVIYVGEKMISLISTADGTAFCSWHGSSGMETIHVFPFGNRFLVCGDYATHIFDDYDVYERKVMSLESVCISPDGQKVAVLSYLGIDIFNHTFEEKLEEHDIKVKYDIRHRLSWRYSILISLDRDSISFFHLSHNNPPSNSIPYLSRVSNLLLSPDSKYLLTIGIQGSIHLWDVESNHRLQTFEDYSKALSPNPTDFHIEYAPDSSCALIRVRGHLAVLQIPSGVLQPITLSSVIDPETPTLAYSKSEILAASFFADSNRILIVQSDGGMKIFSLHDMSQYSVLPLPSQIKHVRQLLVSPSEQLVAICNNCGLIINGIYLDIHHVALSNRVQVAGFSPDGTCLYALEIDEGKWMVSRIDTPGWVVNRIWAKDLGTMGFFGTKLVDTIIEDKYSALSFLWLMAPSYEDPPVEWGQFIDLSSGKSIIPPLPCLTGYHLRYRDYWLMALPKVEAESWSMTRDHFAYVNGCKPLVLDYSPLTNQA